MRRVVIQSLGFHAVALLLLLAGAIMALSMTKEPDIIMVNVDGHMVASHVVARGHACSSLESEMPHPGEHSPVHTVAYSR